jgi:hypothetical protein
VVNDLATPDDRGDSVSDQPYDSAQPHQLASVNSSDLSPVVPDATPDDRGVRAAVLGPTSLMPTVERPDAQPAAPAVRLRWVALIVLAAAAITVVALLTA